MEKSDSKTAPAAAVAEFDNAIKKASKILELDPGSRWADDVVMIIGKSFYYTGRYEDAQIKFEELISNFPYSKFVPEARSLYVRTLLIEGKLELAELELNEIIASDAKSDIKREAYLNLAELLFQRKDYEEAIKVNSEVISELKDNQLKSEAQLKIAESFFLMENYSSAAEEYIKVENFDPSLPVQYSSKFRIGVCLKNLGDYDKAIDQFVTLLLNENFTENYTELMLEIAQCWDLKGDVGQAIYVLERLNVFNPDSLTLDQEMYLSQKAPIHSEQIEADSAFQVEKDAEPEKKPANKSPEALFHIGELYLMKYSDLSKAKEYYSNAVKVNPAPETKNLIDIRLNYINELLALKENKYSPLPDKPVMPVQKDFLIHIDLDSLFTAEDSLLLKPDSTVVNTETVQTDADSIQSLSVITQLASDSTRSGIIDSTIFSPDSSVADTVTIQTGEIAEFDTTQYVQAVEQYKREFLIYQNELTKYNNKLAKGIYRIAELFLMEFDKPDSAYAYLNSLIDGFPESSSTAKALFLLIDIANKHNLGDPDSLKSVLLYDYEYTEYARYFMDDLELDAASETIYISKEDSIRLLFEKAENLLLQGSYDSSIKYYQILVDQYYYSDYAPKSLYAIAWIHEYYLDEPEKAFELYEKLTREYQDSEISKTIIPKLQEATRLKGEMERAEKIAQLRQLQLQMEREKAFQDSIFIENKIRVIGNPFSDIFFTLEHDSLVAQPARIIENAPVVIPDSIIVQEISGIIDIKILIDTNGNPVKLELYRTTMSHPVITENHIAAAEESKYNPAITHDNLPVKAWHFRRFVYPKQ